MTSKRPSENELAILRNLEAGRDFTHGLHSSVAAPAMFRCVLNGWASQNRLTDAGRKALELEKPIKGAHYEVTVIKEEKPKPPILLPPAGGWDKVN